MREIMCGRCGSVLESLLVENPLVPHLRVNVTQRELSDFVRRKELAARVAPPKLVCEHWLGKGKACKPCKRAGCALCRLCLRCHPIGKKARR